MQRNQVVKQATGVSAFLLVGLSIVYSLVKMPMETIFLLGIWSVIVLSVLLKMYVHSRSLLPSVMYILVSTTFLNQSVLTIHVGFFSLFLYRLLLIAAVILFILQVRKEKNLPQSWSQVHVKGILLFLLFWMAYAVVSLLWAISIIDGIKSLFLLGMGISFIVLAVFTFKSMTRLFLFYGIWMVMTVILMMIGFINHFAHIQLPTSTLYGAPEYKLAYPTSVFFNQNDFATFLTISFFFYLSVAKNSQSKLLSTTSFLLSILSVYLIYLTESRASLLGVIIGLIAYFFILLPTFFKKIAALIGSTVLLLIALVFSGKFVHLVDQFLSASASYPSNEILPSNVARLNLLRNTLHFSLESFGFGVGAGNIPFYLKNKPIYATNNVVEVHNWLAEIMGNYGIIILLGYVTMYAYLFFRLYAFYKTRIGRKYKGLLEACMLGMIGFLVSSISPSSISNLFFHWVFLGLVISTVSVFTGKNNQLHEENSY
ncbi:teichuronic acid biosynthesis protein TuaE [Neobacillus soli]|uniref:teichuronic acid biosynthesis protein TuaE n=1 Tax=Neobacillus soli TaxID=220688 RepID=UPI00082709F5|nr:O-antigen ligase family protein [Neobacillus soli]